MNNFLTMFGGEAFLAAIVAVHWMYFRAFFSRDTLLIIELRLPRSASAEGSVILSGVSHTPPGIGGSERLTDRVIIDDRLLVLDGVISETALVCLGDVEVRAGAVVGASMKVRGNLHAEANVTFLGPVVVNGGVRAGAGCAFLFDVVAKGGIAVGKGTQIGGRALLTTLV